MSIKITRFSPDLLFFDERNPRLVEMEKTTNQTKILNTLWRTEDVKVIVMSILANNFFPNEALYIIEENGRKVVVEGNRRLAAVKAILNPSLVEKGGMDKYIPSITNKLRNSLQAGIPVIEMASREETWRYIGFKHVSGAAKWDSYAKAHYIAQVHNEYHVPLEQIAEQIGDSNQLTMKLYQGLMVLRQADSQTEFKIEDVYNNRVYFSHIYTAMGYDGVRDFLGITVETQDTSSPVSQDKLKHLEEFMIWVLGSRKSDLKPIIKSQNPDLRNLNQVLLSSEATETLRITGSLDEAFEASESPTSILYKSIVDANLKIQKALSKISSYDGDEEILKSVIKLADSADTLYDSMKQIYKQKNKKEDSPIKRSLD